MKVLVLKQSVKKKMCEEIIIMIISFKEVFGVKGICNKAGHLNNYHNSNEDN